MVAATLRTEGSVLLEGRVAMVAGAGPGLGREIALSLAGQGADILLGSDRAERVAAVAGEVRGLGRRAEVLPLDPGDAESCGTVLKTCRETFGGLDVLVANAADDGGATPIEDDVDEWRQVMEATLWGMLEVARAAVPLMAERGRGRIVFVDAAPAWRDQAGRGAHAAASAALVAATRSLAAELGPRGIRVNAVHPGTIWGPAVKARLRAAAQERGATPEAIYRELTAGSSLGYLPRPAEVAGSVLFLASDLAKPITGQSLGVDAGRGL
jgi:NAD(P)-dependent dehydrogenase (short-subunit alcohol dehydrogenase family)